MSSKLSDYGNCVYGQNSCRVASACRKVIVGQSSRTHEKSFKRRLWPPHFQCSSKITLSGSNTIRELEFG